MRATFYYIAGGLLMGVLWRSFFEVHVAETTALFVGLLLLFGMAVLLGFHRSVAYVTLFFLVTILGVTRTEFAFQSFHEGKVFIVGEKISGTGMVASEPDERDEYTVLHILVDGFEGDTTLRVTVDQNPTFVYGEKIFFEGVVEEPETFVTDTGRTFDYAGYLMKDGTHYQLQRASVGSLDVVGGSVIKKTLFKIKSKWLEAISQLIPEPSASLAGGVIVGAKRSLGDTWLDAFRDTGIIHIVVLSGYNLTLIANSIVRMTTSLPKSVGFGFGVLGVVSFASMVGAGATVVRASIMAILGMLATFLYRPYMLLRALILAGVGMVLWNPFVLVYDPGFQLSFLATTGLIFISPYFEKRLLWIPDVFGLRAIVSATFATQLAVFPLLIFQMGRVSLVAPIVNVLILPFVPFVMLTGFIAGLLGMASTFLALPFAWITHIVLSYMFLIVALCNSFPYAAMTLPILPMWSLLLVYAFFPLLYFYKRKITKPI